MVERGVSYRILTCVMAAFACCADSEPVRPVPVPASARQPSGQVALPNKTDSLHFAVIGDNGTGDKAEYDVGAQMASWNERFRFPIVLMLGDNIYGPDRPQDMVQKFEAPYKALLDRGVKFYASLGNHDSRDQRYYKLFNMDGKLYYTFKAPQEDVRFFALESSYMDPFQLKWLEDALKASDEKWKIAFFHHPLYSSARTHGSQVNLRTVLEPLFVQYKVSVVLSGHDHTYERIVPQSGIQYFVEGSSGQLRRGDLRKPSPLTAFGNDTEQAFMLMEIDADTLTFNAITKSGAIIDSGVITRRK